MPKVREAIKLIEADGWRTVTTKGSHRQFKYPRRTAQPLTRQEREGIRAVWGCECCGWDSGRKPYPGKKARGQRLGLGRRTNASGKVTWRHPESTKSIVAPVADQHVSQTVVWDIPGPTQRWRAPLHAGIGGDPLQPGPVREVPSARRGGKAAEGRAGRELGRAGAAVGLAVHAGAEGTRQMDRRVGRTCHDIDRRLRLAFRERRQNDRSLQSCYEGVE